MLRGLTKWSIKVGWGRTSVGKREGKVTRRVTEMLVNACNFPDFVLFYGYASGSMYVICYQTSGWISRRFGRQKLKSQGSSWNKQAGLWWRDPVSLNQKRSMSACPVGKSRPGELASTSRIRLLCCCCWWEVLVFCACVGADKGIYSVHFGVCAWLCVYCLVLFSFFQFTLSLAAICICQANKTKEEKFPRPWLYHI